MIDEIEIGPHFITFYGKDLHKLNNLALRYSRVLGKKHPEIASVQQENFTHEAKDPNVYHPYGNPEDFRENYRHFHIRTIKKPEADLIDSISLEINRLEPGAISPRVKVTKLEDFKLPDKQHLVYPDQEEGEEYLDYIDRLRTGEWLKV